MRTSIVIDDALMGQAMQASGARTKREAVEVGLSTLLQPHQGAQDHRWDHCHSLQLLRRSLRATRQTCHCYSATWT
jgi:Arc/MetJ family transcription regulator